MNKKEKIKAQLKLPSILDNVYATAKLMGNRDLIEITENIRKGEYFYTVQDSLYSVRGYREPPSMTVAWNKLKPIIKMLDKNYSHNMFREEFYILLALSEV